MKIPCKDCIVLAACRPKKTVYCDLLEAIATELPKSPDELKGWWTLVNTYLPKAVAILDSKGR